MDALPLISICVPSYNDGEFLRQSLLSIIAQSYPKLEILVADDASTDDTAAIVRALGDPRIQYHRNEKNLGQFENVNSALRRARGKYVAVYHSDDLYEPSIVEKESAFLEAHPEAGAVFALDRRIDADGNILGVTPVLPGVATGTSLGLQDLMPILMRHKNRLIRGPTFMARREIFNTVGWFNGTDYDIAGDFEMYLRITTAFKIGILGEHLMRYRRGRTQVSTKYEYLRTCEEHFFPIMDKFLARPEIAVGLDPAAYLEYEFHRCDDRTFRATNWVIRGDVAQATELLRHPYPWRALLADNRRRRKLRVIFLRTVVRVGLAFGARRLLARFLAWFEYGGKKT